MRPMPSSAVLIGAVSQAGRPVAAALTSTWPATLSVGLRQAGRTRRLRAGSTKTHSSGYQRSPVTRSQVCACKLTPKSVAKLAGPMKAVSNGNPIVPDGEAPAVCLERLAAALSGYADLVLAMRTGGPAPCLAVRNAAAPVMAETITVRGGGEGLAYRWSWGQRICDANDPDSAAQAVAYVLEARGAQLGETASDHGHG